MTSGGIHVVEMCELVAYLVVCVLIGFIYSKRSQSSEEEYWVAGRFLNKTWGAFAMYAVIGSASTIMGSAGIAYKAGAATTAAIALGFAMQFPIIAFTTCGPLLEKNICTLGDFFQEKVGGKHVKWAYSIISLVFMAMYVVPNLKAGTIISNYLTGGVIDFKVMTIIMGVILLVYSCVGGMWAVTITDIIQGVIMMAGVVLLGVVILFNLGEFGGFKGLIDATIAAKPGITQMGYAPLSAIGLALIWALYGLVSPSGVMRVLTMNNGKSAKRSMLLGSILASVTVIIATFIAMVATTIDPALENADMAFIIVMEKYFPTVINGFLVASLFAAIMSSVDSFLLSCSATIARDIYKGLINPKADEKQVIRLGMISLWVVGAIVIAVSLFNLPLISILAGWAAGGCISAFAAPLVIGLYWKGISRNGVFWSMISGIVVYIGLNRSGVFPAMAEILVAVPVSVIVCFVVSKLSPNKEKA